ncbi:winged helix-turn-helix domain-containing protein [Microbispora sp. RL4-1S]|uniref:Winged helix-turn-helix domain-containing protein n=1 Tax=Microbispora oryzae TaxID=2806554 RepID=A0A941AHY9_9ACTN|nr:BTAD domain-containing putative transcriptional regulator [Microbispora oryzae]MBP2703227.1 winged helix-turn-helix domain-containing protein [Microbispora oryzae]
MGAFSVQLHGAPVRRWHAGKARSLFQYLLVNRGRVVLRDTLYEVLWPDQEWSPGSSSLKVAAHALRRMLLESGAPARIEHQDFGYVLRAEDVWVDAEELQASFSAGRVAELRGDHETAAARYRRVAALHRGDYLAGETADWVYEQREWYRSLALRALTYLRGQALARNDYPEVIEWSRQALAIDRYQEETYQALMIAHGRLGELDRVRSWHELCVRRLGEELNLEPTAETARILANAMQGRLRSSAA